MGAEQSLDLQLAGYKRKQTTRQFTACWGLDSERLDLSYADADAEEVKKSKRRHSIFFLFFN